MLLTKHLHLKCVLGRERSVGAPMQKGFKSVSSSSLKPPWKVSFPHCEAHTGWRVCVYSLFEKQLTSAPEKLITDITDRPCLPLAKLSP